MIWGCMSDMDVGKLYFVDGTATAAKYKQILRQLIAINTKYKYEKLTVRTNNMQSLRILN